MITRIVSLFFLLAYSKSSLPYYEKDRLVLLMHAIYTLKKV